MKKLIYLISLLVLCCSCKNYSCELKYEVVYPDTTWINTYVFDASSDVYYSNRRVGGDKQLLIVYPTGGGLPRTTLCIVPNETAEINVLDFKIYRYGIDIPSKKEMKKYKYEKLSIIDKNGW